MAMDPENEELILKFVQGRLSADERASFELRMRADPRLAAEVAAMVGVRSALTDAATDAVERERGWRRLSEAIDAETAAPQPSQPQSSQPVAANDNRLLSRLLGAPLARAAGIAVAAVLAWEAGVSSLFERQPSQVYTPVSEAPSGVVAAVAFAPEASVAEISALLRRIGATVSDGPSALGVYRLGFETEAARDAALSELDAETTLVLTATPQ